MKYERCTLKTTQVIVSEPKCWQSSLVTLTFDPKMYRYLPLTILHLFIKYERCALNTTQVIVSEPKCWQSSLVTLTFDPKMYRYFPFAILHLCMKYESCTLKTTQVIVSEPKCWQSSLVTLTFDLLTPNCIGIFLLPSCIDVWNMKAVHWKLLKLSCQNQSVDKVPLWPWPLTFWPKMYRHLPLTILHLCMKYESCTLKIVKLSCQNQSVDKV